MFWNRSDAPPSQQILSVPPSPEDHRSAAETVSELLLSYAKCIFDTEYLSAREAQLRCSEWAAASLRTAPQRRLQLNGGQETPRTDWSGLVSFFSEHRRAESLSVSAGRNDLGESIRGFARMFQEALQTDQGTDQATMKLLLRISNGLASDDDVQVLSGATELVHLVQQQTLEREQLSAKRIATLQAHVAKLERSVAGNRNPSMLDASTRLHNAQAFAEHVEFLSAVGRLFSCPPCLVIYRVNLASLPAGSDLESCATRLADGLVRVLFAAEHYVARTQPNGFAAVLSGLTVDEALKQARQARLSALEASQIPSLEIGAVVCSLVSGEPAATWEARARAELPAGNDCVLCGIPASFCDEETANSD